MSLRGAAQHAYLCIISIAIFRTSPTSMAGTVGAIFNGALQLGSAIGISAVGSIETSVEARNGGSQSYAGRAAAFWFLLAIVGIEWVALLVFYRRSKEGAIEELEGGAKTLEKTIEDEKMVLEKQSADLPELRLSSSTQDFEQEEHTTVSERPVNRGTDMNV